VVVFIVAKKGIWYTINQCTPKIIFVQTGYQETPEVLISKDLPIY